jgi:hypothetical protein
VSVHLRIVLATLVLALGAAAPAHAAPAAPSGLAVADLIAHPGVYDPQFTWTAVTGARGYEVEINSTSYWAPGSKVCCSHISSSANMTTFGTSYSPSLVLLNNTYFWRVRAVDASGVAGTWAAGPSFTKDFASAPAVVPSVTNLRLVDTSFATLPAGSSVATPIVLWDPVPGASSYQVGVAPFTTGACDWSAAESVRWDKRTATAGWTPLGWSRGINADPLANGELPEDDLMTHLVTDQAYCVRVRPVDRSSAQIGGPEIFGDWTYLPANNVAAFTWSGPPAVAACTPCNPDANDYLRPVSDSTVGQMPVFSWDPVPGAQSYFVVVARDPQFTTVIDYAYTRVTAYAPRTQATTTGYADETTDYYWAVLPAAQADGHGVSTDTVSSNPQPFGKQATPSTLLGPANGTVVSAAATVFHWTPVVGARRYRLQVSEDPTFVNVLAEQGSLSSGAVTDSTAYTSSSAYPTGKTLYWRVQAEAENGSKFVGLRWSATGTFTRTATSSGSTTTADKRFSAAIAGYPVRRVWRRVTLTIRNRATRAPVASAWVKVSGAGVRATTKRTGTLGKVTFRIRATRYPGTVTYRVSKAGFRTAYFRQSVRRR